MDAWFCPGGRGGQLSAVESGGGWSTASEPGGGGCGCEIVTGPNIFFYNLDDLRDAVPGGVDPLQYMPKVRSWMAAGTRYPEQLRGGSGLLSVPGSVDDRSLPAQQRGPAPG